jgi:phosphoribosylglycinamide formyltransferase-1
MNEHPSLRLVVLISGSGSNLQAIIDGCADGSIDAEVAAVISNRPDVRGLQRAAKANIPAEVVDHTGYDSRAAFERALIGRIDSHRPDLVILAGFMRILTPEFVRHYAGRMLNIHPSLLPRFQGLHTHRRVLEAGDTEHGASVHFVTEELDGGPVVLQAVVPVLAGDDADRLAARVLAQEHRIYPAVIQWIAAGRVRLDAQQGVLFDGTPLPRPIRWTS